MNYNNKGGVTRPITHHKGTYFDAQFQKTFASFLEHPKTMKMVSVETQIDRGNICRYVAEMERLKQIQLVKKDVCHITHCIAGYYTTDSRLFKWPNPEPSLF